MSIICHIQNWALLISRYKGISTFTDNAIPEFLHVPPKSEEGEFIYELMLEQSEGIRPVETLLLHNVSEDYLNETDHLFGNSNSKWALEFELITLVACQKLKLQHWAEMWDLLDPVLIKETQKIAEMSGGVLINKEQFLVLFEWNAKHIFSLPVHNALAEKQYLDPNMSE